MSRPQNWIVVVTRNALALTKRAIPSMLAQRGVEGLHILVVDNGSSDNTLSYLHALSHAEPVRILPISPQRSVAHAWNTALRYIFSTGVEHALVCNNDIWLRPDTYVGLLAAGGPFITAVGEHSKKNVVEGVPDLMHQRPHPDFSCFLIKRSTWETVGPFDENFRTAYGEDCDYHCRMHLAGIRALSAQLPFWHADGGSGTLKWAMESERAAIQLQATANRIYFEQKWGFAIGSPEYEAFFLAPQRVVPKAVRPLPAAVAVERAASARVDALIRG